LPRTSNSVPAASKKITLVICYWFLVIGYLLLVIGFWLFDNSAVETATIQTKSAWAD